ncbi:hypothetical protein PYCC9005_001762 [Savitreella phatthalungensis]
MARRMIMSSTSLAEMWEYPCDLAATTKDKILRSSSSSSILLPAKAACFVKKYRMARDLLWQAEVSIGGPSLPAWQVRIDINTLRHTCGRRALQCVQRSDGRYADCGSSHGEAQDNVF